uniref:Uncharacterized protein n=1 Tax=Rhizophora mucronata TaxID=61149 RepID=A0A2P2PL60_RHIMU
MLVAASATSIFVSSRSFT